MTETIEAPAYLATMNEAQFQALIVETAQTFGWLAVHFRQMVGNPSLPNGTVICQISIPGNPLPKERPRTANGRVYSPVSLVAAQNAVGTIAKQGMTLDEPDDGHDLAVDVSFHRATGNRVDIDNLVKLVFDGCNKVVWKDDGQIVELNARLTRKDPDPRTDLVVRVVGNRSVGVCARCGAAIRVPIGADAPSARWVSRGVGKTYCSAHCYHNRLTPHDPEEADAMTGWPDLILIRGRRTLFRELKTDRGTVSPRQQEWIDRLSAVGADVAVWRPMYWTNILLDLQTDA